MSEISIGDRAMRKFALLLLDSSDGIDKRAYEILSVMLTESNNEDILEHVDIVAAGDRAYIGEDFASDELAKLTIAEDDAEMEKEARLWEAHDAEEYQAIRESREDNE